MLLIVPSEIKPGWVFHLLFYLLFIIFAVLSNKANTMSRRQWHEYYALQSKAPMWKFPVFWRCSGCYFYTEWQVTRCVPSSVDTKCNPTSISTTLSVCWQREQRDHLFLSFLFFLNDPLVCCLVHFNIKNNLQ